MIKSYLPHFPTVFPSHSTNDPQLRLNINGKLNVNLVSSDQVLGGCVTGGHLSEEPVELHSFGCGVAALDEARSAVHVHQALVVVVVNGGTEEPDMKLLSTGVVHILQETPHPAMNSLCSAALYVHTVGVDI